MAKETKRHQLDQLTSSISSLRSGKYSDFSIRCSDNTVIPAHRAIVCPRSRVISAAIDGQFAEAAAQEIHLEDDEPDIVGKMVDFLYTADYDDERGDFVVDPNTLSHGYEIHLESLKIQPVSLNIQPVSLNIPDGYQPTSLLINAKVYIIADKYEIESLKELSSIKFKELLPLSWNGPAFADSARLVYENTIETDRVLRDAIWKVASDNIKHLLDRGEFLDLLKAHGDLATDILSNVVRGSERIPEDTWSYRSIKKDKRKNRVVFDES